MKNIVFAVVSASLLCSCNWFSGKEKELGFYEYSRTYDLFRLPLVKPYELISADEGYTWTMKFRANPPVNKLGSGKIDSVGVKGNYFVLYNHFAYVNHNNSEAWYVVEGEKKEEKVFTDQVSYKRYLKEKDLSDLLLYDVNQVFQKFDKEGKLPTGWKAK